MTAAPHRTPPRLLITAAAGYGKSALLAAHCPDAGIVMSAPTLVAEGLPEEVPWLGIDDLHRVAADDHARIADLLTRRPGLGVAVTSRFPIGTALRDRLPGRVCQRAATDLALTAYETARLLADAGVADAETAVRVAELTAGWPALVHFAGDVLGRDAQADVLDALTSPGAPAADWVRTAVLSDLPSGAEEVLRALAHVDTDGPLTQSVCDALATELGGTRLPGMVEQLCRTGVLVRRRGVGRTSDVVMVPVVAHVLREGCRRPPARIAVTVAQAHEADDAWLPAARAHGVAGNHEAVVRLVVDRGEEMVRHGQAGPVVRLVEEFVGTALVDAPEPLRSTYAEALRISGDPAGARRVLAPLVARADATSWPAALAVRVAGLHYMCGEFDDALEVLDRCPDPLDAEPTPRCGADVVDRLACRVHVLAMLGRHDEAEPVAARCLEVAERLGDARMLGVAHLAVSRTCRGTLSELHLDEALRCSTAANDAMTATRVLAARTWLLLAGARYDRACVSAREAARMARQTCPPGLQAVALHNLGEALGRVGALDEALWHLQCSVALCRRLGPARAALPLLGMADVHRALGHEEQSRAAYLEAVELARESGDAQLLVPALCGLALLPGSRAEHDPDDQVGEALRIASPDVRPIALTTAGRVALAHGDRPAALDLAGQAVDAAREERAADLLADALELQSSAVEDPARARRALREALSIWSAGGAEPAVARVEVLIGRLADADGTERSRAREAARTLGRLGIPVPGGSVTDGEAGAGVVGVRVLGPFAVTVEGVEVPLPAWRSRQARTLVKILAAHRGRVVTRARVCDLLWPDDDPARTGHRLSVLLAAVRGVLDPTKAWPPDRFITADQHGIRLNLGPVALDADLVLRDAAHAAALADGGAIDEAREVLAHVDAMYRGEAFEDEPEEWADGLREEVRAAWVRSVRRLAALQAQAGRTPDTLGILVRLLAVDPYDEQVHRRLVNGLLRAGRHGEARRAFERWRQAMDEIGAPGPDPRIVGVASASRPPVPVLTPR